MVLGVGGWVWVWWVWGWWGALLALEGFQVGASSSAFLSVCPCLALGMEFSTSLVTSDEERDQYDSFLCRFHQRDCDRARPADIKLAGSRFIHLFCLYLSLVSFRRSSTTTHRLAVDRLWRGIELTQILPRQSLPTDVWRLRGATALDGSHAPSAAGRVVHLCTELVAA